MIGLAVRWLGRHVAGLAVVAGLAGISAGVVGLNRWLDARDAATRQAVEAEARIAALERENARLIEERDARAEAAAVLRAYTRRMAAEAAARSELIEELRSMEGADAPLSDYLRDAGGRLWPAGDAAATAAGGGS